MVTKEIIQKWMLENKGSILQDPEDPEVFTGYVTFTPERASSALESNVRNRKMGTNRQVPALVEVMEDGLWDSNVSKINFNRNSELSDGQNRLFAGVKSNTTFRCLVTWGVKSTAQLVTDRRGTRTLSDDLSISGYQNVHNLSAIAKIMYLRQQGRDVKQIINKGASMNKVPDVSVYNFFLEHEDAVIESQRLATRTYRSVRDLHINGATLNVLAIEFDSINREDARAFWERLSDGITTTEDDPVIMLRKRLSENARSKTSKIPKPVEAALIIKAWNYYIRGETTKCLKFTSGGSNPEPFPEIYNPYLESEEAD